MKNLGSKWLWALMLVASVALAEDIDLFVGSNPPAVADYPNVIILIDNTSNWTAANQGWVGGVQGEAELDAIVTVVNSLAAPGQDAPINLGIMLLTEKSGNTDKGGAYVRSKVKPMTAANRTALTSMLTTLRNNINAPSEKVNASLGFDQAIFEVFKYFGGYTSVANATNNTAGSPVSSTHFGAKRYAKLDDKKDASAYTDATGLNYNPVISPSASPTCASKNYLILVGNGWIPAEKEGKTYIGQTLLDNVGGNTTQAYSTSAVDVRYADEMTRFLYQTDVSAAPGQQNVITYAIDVYKNQPSAELTALLKSASQGVGGGAYYKATSAAEIVDSLGSILAAIQTKNSAFASVSLPVSVNTQGTYLNQVFIGMFRPEAAARPRWHGNLKQYRLAYVGDTLKLVDAQNTTPRTSAISTSNSGFINECAVSYWTPAKGTADGYWANLTQKNCPPYEATSNSPDGNLVEKGGQGYKLRGMTPAARTVKTCAVVVGGGCATVLTNFDDLNLAITSSALGVPAGTRTELINWVRGENTEAEAIGVPATGTPLSTAELKQKMRPSSHGDVVHSRPVAVNFAATDNDPTQVVVFYGSNDGLLRAVNGNRDGGAQVGGKNPGEELWSFVAPESYGMFARLKNNTPSIDFPNNTSPSAQPKDYGFDGPVTAYKTATSAWIFATMRRGGRMLYAFNVPSATPQSPTLKWRVGCPNQLNDTDCTAGMSGIGQTWGVPSLIKAAGYLDALGASKPMLIMGGGYDPCEDSDSPTAACKSSGKGHGIYLLDADTGEVKKMFATEGGVVGDITVLKDNTGLAMYAYAADLNGNVYRISGTANAPIGSVAPGSWTITKLAALGGSGSSARKFLFGPDVVTEGGVNYVLLGSGDREKPLDYYSNALAVDDYFFMLKDQPTEASWLSDELSNCGAANLCMNSLLAITTSATPTDSELSEKKGWALRLTSREKVVTSALTIFGTVYFSTQEPSQALLGSCSPDLGYARTYSISFRNAKGEDGERFERLVGDGLPPSPVAGLVTLDDGSTVPFCIGCSGSSALEGSEPPVPPSAVQPKSRVFWNIEQ